jgi:hypothetical protein
VRAFEFHVELAAAPPPPAHPLPHQGRGESAETDPHPDRLGNDGSDRETETIEGLRRLLAGIDGVESVDIDPDRGCFRIVLPDFGSVDKPLSFGALSHRVEEYGRSVGCAMRVGTISRVVI